MYQEIMPSLKSLSSIGLAAAKIPLNMNEIVQLCERAGVLKKIHFDYL
jgi:hypothetical protein